MPDYHTFVVHGTNPVYLVYLPMFHMAKFQEQLILRVDLPDHVREACADARKDAPGIPFSISTADEEILSDILVRGSFTAIMDTGLPTSRRTLSDPEHWHFQTDFEATNVRIVRRRSLDSRLLDDRYPTLMPFYLYGTKEQLHIDHILLCSPNVQLSSDMVKLDIPDYGDIDLDEELEEGLIAVMDDVRESVMQPFGTGHDPTFFKPNRTFRVSIYRDSSDFISSFDGAIARGTITLGDCVYRDFDKLNRDLTSFVTKSKRAAMPEFEAFRNFITGDSPSFESDFDGLKLAPSCPSPQTVLVDGVQLADRYEERVCGDRSRNLVKRSSWKVSLTTDVSRG